MYNSYVSVKFPQRRHHATILDVEVDHAIRNAGARRLWWISTIAIAIAGLAGWIATLPKG
jgi:hypothetical protein